MASFGIGAKLRQERVFKGLSLDDISRDTKIAPRFLEAIEKDDFARLPGLLFTRNFVRQYALVLELDPEPMLAELPKLDESMVRLPDPPARPRSSYRSEGRLRSLYTSTIWLVLAGGAAYAGYMAFNRTTEMHAASAVQEAAPVAEHHVDMPPPAPAESTPGSTPEPAATVAPAAPVAASSAVQVSLLAHEDAWVDVSADGKKAFTGTLKPNETKDIAAADHVRISTGNAGALTISLNGKTLDPIGPIGQVRVVKLTAEGPQLLSKAPPPAPDPL